MEPAQGESRSEEAARGDRKRHRRKRTEAGSGLRRRVGPAAVGSRRPWWVEERAGGTVRVSVRTLGDECGDTVGRTVGRSRRPSTLLRIGGDRACYAPPGCEQLPLQCQPAATGDDQGRLDVEFSRLLCDYGSSASWRHGGGKAKPAAGLTAGLLPARMLHRIRGNEVMQVRIAA